MATIFTKNLTQTPKVSPNLTSLIPLDKTESKKSKKAANIGKEPSQQEVRQRKIEKGQTETKPHKEEAHHHHMHDLKEQIGHKIHDFIGHIDHLPDFLKFNKFIHTGYRVNFSTPKKILKR